MRLHIFQFLGIKIDSLYYQTMYVCDVETWTEWVCLSEYLLVSKFHVTSIQQKTTLGRERQETWIFSKLCIDTTMPRWKHCNDVNEPDGTGINWGTISVVISNTGSFNYVHLVHAYRQLEVMKRITFLCTTQLGFCQAKMFTRGSDSLDVLISILQTNWMLESSHIFQGAMTELWLTCFSHAIGEALCSIMRKLSYWFHHHVNN